MSTTSTPTPVPMIESLENRTFLSASPLTPLQARYGPDAPHYAPMDEVSYNIKALLGYDRRKVSWKYWTQWTSQSNEADENGSGNSKVAIARGQKRYDGVRSNVVTYSIRKTKVITAWVGDAAGLRQTYLYAKDPYYGMMSLTISGLNAAPAAMSLGEGFSDDCTMTGKIKFRYDGRWYSGPVLATGTYTVSVGNNTVSVDVPAGSYQAVPVTISLGFTGNVSTRIGRQRVNVSLDCDYQAEFQSVPDVGVVQSDMSIDTHLEYDGYTANLFMSSSNSLQ